MTDSEIQAIANQVAINTRQLIIEELDRRTRLPTGVYSGGPFTTFSVNDQGELIQSGTALTTIATATNTSVATGSSDHDVPFVVGDTAGWVTATPAMVLPYGGSVLVIVTINWQKTGSPFTSLVGDRQLRIQQIRSASVYDEIRVNDTPPLTTSYFENHNNSALFDVIAGDIINLQVSHDSGITLKCFGDVRIAYQ